MAPKKSSDKKQQTEHLCVLLSQLQKLPRFSLLSSLQIEHFLGADMSLPKKIRQMSLGDLVEHSQDEEQIAGLKISTRSIETLCRLLNGLTTEDSASMNEESLHKTEDSPQEQQDSSAIESGPTELVLQGLIDRLRASPHLQSNATRRLGDFWESGWPRAPFEEVFTLRQLAQMEPYILLKKRSVTEKKSHYIHLALQKALVLCEGTKKEPEPHSIATLQQTVTADKSLKGEEQALFADSLYALNVCIDDRFKELKDFIDLLAQHFTARELEFLLLSYRYMNAEVAPLFQLDEQACHARSELLLERLYDMSVKSSQKMKTLLGTLKLMPLVLIDKVEQLMFPDIPATAVRVYIRLVLVAFGFRELRYKGSPVPGVAVQREGVFANSGGKKKALEEEVMLESFFTLLDKETARSVRQLLENATDNTKL